MPKQIHIQVLVDSEDTCHTSFYFKGATVGQLSMINHELDILKQEVISRIKDAPKDYEITDFGDGQAP